MHKLLKQAFTLIELLVVIAIIGILSGLIIVGMSGMTNNANIAKGQVFSNSLRNALLMNLVSEWKLDQVNVPIANQTPDSWKGTNPGTLQGASGSQNLPQLQTTGCVYGNCLKFDGTDDYVDFGNNSSLSMGTGDATVSLWVYFNNAVASQEETLVNCGAGTDAAGVGGYWITRQNGTSILYGEFSDGTANRIAGYLSPSNTLIANTWYNIVVVFTRASTMQAYINGVKQANSLNISSKTQNVTNAYSYKIGAWSSAYYFLTGKMDDVRIYNAAIPTSQIREQYYAELNKLLANRGITKEEYQNRIGELAIGL